MKNIFLILLLSSSLLSCLPQDGAVEVTEQYWAAIQSGDLAGAQKLTTSSSQDDLTNYFVLNADQTVSLGEMTIDKTQASVATLIVIKDDGEASNFSFNTSLILINEQWKVKAKQTMKTAQAAQQTQAMQNTLDSMGDAITKGAGLLSDFLEEGSKELNKALDQAIDDMEQHNYDNQTTDNNGGAI